MTRLTRNLIANVTGQGLVLILGVIAVRFIFRHLGNDVFGIIFFNIVLTQLFTSSLELGVSATIVREVSSHQHSEPDYVRSVIATASALYWGAGVLLVAVIWLIAPFLVTHWVNLTSLDRDTAATMLRLMSATSLVVLPKALYTSVFRGRQLMHINNAIDVMSTAVQQGGILVVLLVGGEAYAVASWISVSALLSVAAYVVMAARQVGWRSLVPSFSPATVRRNLGFTGHMMVISILSLVQIQAAQVIVSKLVAIVQFGFYSFASNTVSRGSFVTTAAAQAAFPSFSALHAAADRYGLMQQYRKLQDLVCFGVLPLFTGVCFAALPVYTFVFNERVATQLLLPTALLALGSWMNGTLNMPYMLSIAMGRPQIAARTNVYAIVIVLPVTAGLIAVYGLPGAAFSWVFYHLFMYAYMVPRITRECLDSPPWAWYLQVVKVLGLAAVTYGIAWLAVTAIGMFTLPVLVVAYVIGSIAFALGAYLMIGSDLRETLQRMRGSLITRKANVM